MASAAAPRVARRGRRDTCSRGVGGARFGFAVGVSDARPNMMPRREAVGLVPIDQVRPRAAVGCADWMRPRDGHAEDSISQFAARRRRGISCPFSVAGSSAKLPARLPQLWNLTSIKNSQQRD
ncbi:hypothetical protein EJB05_35768, partial [Eragrostis curvula]